MPHNRIIVLGPTGVSKNVALQRLKTAATQQLQRELKIIDFEKDIMPQAALFGGWPGFLLANMPLQARIWRDAWEILKNDYLPATSSDVPVILSLHGAYVRADEGIRSVIDLQRICEDFKPSMIITLIDDVYNMWWRTERRAGGEDLKGRPSLEQLLIARRAEVEIGDLISCQASLPTQPKHIVLSVHHPVDVFLEIAIFGADVAYLSFPISAPRELKRDEDDSSFIDAINDYHRKVFAEFRAKQRPKKAFISPLAIDELPLCEAVFGTVREGLAEHLAGQLQGQPDLVEQSDLAEQLAEQLRKATRADNEKLVNFDPANQRWPVSDLWGDAVTLADTPPDPIPIPLSQARNVTGLVATDVGWRDYKLVRQARSLGIFCPKPRNRDRLTRGVEAELRAAVQAGGDTAVYIWQDPAWDTQDLVGQQLGNPGSMGSDPFHLITTIVDSLDDLVARTLS